MIFILFTWWLPSFSTVKFFLSPTIWKKVPVCIGNVSLRQSFYMEEVILGAGMEGMEQGERPKQSCAFDSDQAPGSWCAMAPALQNSLMRCTFPSWGQIRRLRPSLLILIGHSLTGRWYLHSSPPEFMSQVDSQRLTIAQHQRSQGPGNYREVLRPKVRQWTWPLQHGLEKEVGLRGC